LGEKNIVAIPESVNAKITPLLQAYEQTATSATIKGSLRKAGMDLDVRPCRSRFELLSGD
jgi:hypothetical protein